MSKVNYEQNSSFEFILPSFFLALVLVFFIFINVNYFPTFVSDGIIGNAIIHGVDVAKRIGAFYLLILIGLPILILLLNRCFFKMFNKIDNVLKKELNLLSTIGIIVLFLMFIGKSQNLTLNLYPSVIVILEVLFIIFIVYLIYLKNAFLNLKNINWAFLASIPFAHLGALFISRFQQNYCFVIFFLIYGVSSILLFFISNYKKINYNVLQKSFLFLLLAPIMESLYLELYNILNQYNIVINRKILIIFLIYIFCLILTVMYYVLNRKRQIKFEYQRIYYPIIILLFSLFALQVHLINVVDTDFFETANSGEGVFEFFKFGKIPILETFDAHMLKYQIWGILYSLINHDVFGGVFCYEVGYIAIASIISYLIIYVFLSKFISRDLSFLTVLFLPLTFDLGLWNFAFALIPVLFLLKAVEKKTTISYAIFWLSVVLLCFYQLDMGAAVTISAVILLIYLNRTDKQKILKVFKPLILLIVCIFALYLTLCYIKDINPTYRLLEFLKISLSNANWALDSIGNTEKLSYTIYYFIFPMFMILSLLFLFHKNKKDWNIKNIALIFLNLIYIFNFQRGLVRHSLIENDYYRGASFFLIYFVLFLYEYRFRSNKKIKFLLVYATVIVFSSFLSNGDALHYNNLINNSVVNYTSFAFHNEKAKEKVKRFVLSSEMNAEIKDLNALLNILLEKNETYLDFSNQTLLYALFNREKPVYVNQSPGLINGEFLQQLFLNEIDHFSKEVPVVIKAYNKKLSNSMDGIPNDYRYFLISERLFQDYQPLALTNDYEIWVKNDRFDDMKHKIEYMKNVTLIEKENYEEKQTTIDLFYLPYIIGTTNNEYHSLKSSYNNELTFVNELIDKRKGNYVEIAIESKFDTEATLYAIFDNKLVKSYNFFVKAGVHKYSIRISTLYEWYENINKLIVDTNDLENTRVNAVSIMQN